MVEPLKKLTVSYGAFSCTLEGFDDPFPVMKQVVDYFQDLADRDPGFGAHPERPDADYLRSLAQRSAGTDEVEAEVHEGGVILRQSGEAATAFAGMEVVEETVVVTPSAFQPEFVEEETVEDAELETPDSLLVEVAETEEFEDAAEQPQIDEEADVDTPGLVEASEVAELIDADPLPEMADDDQPQIDEMAALHADMERFDSEPVVDTAPVAAELPDILKPDWEPTEAIAPMFEDFPGVSDDDLAASEREVTEMALDTGDAANITTMYIEGEPDSDEAEEAEVEMQATDTEAEPEIDDEAEEIAEAEKAVEEPKTKTSLVSKLPNWAAGLIRPSASIDLNDDVDVVDLGTDEVQADHAESDMNGTTAAEDIDPEDAALERLLKVTLSRREEPDTSDTDALSEIRDGILSMTPTPNPEWNDDEDATSGTADTEDASEADAVVETAEAADEEEAPVAADAADDDFEVTETEEAEAEVLAAPKFDAEIETSDADDAAIVEDEAPDEADDFAEDEDEIEAASVFDAETETTASKDDTPAIILEKPVQVLEPLQLTTVFKVSDKIAEDVAPEETATDEASDEIAAADTGEPAVASEETEDTAQDRSTFRLVHNRKEEAEETTEMSEAPTAADDDLSLAIFASKVGAASLPELLEASAAYTTIVAGQTRFSRRSIMGMLDEMGTERKYSQEARIKSFGKLIRSGTILRVEDGQFAISRSAKFNYEMKIGA